MKREGENKVPSTALAGAMEGGGEPAARREPHGAGEGSRTLDLELGKIRAASDLSPGLKCGECLVERGHIVSLSPAGVCSKCGEDYGPKPGFIRARERAEADVVDEARARLDLPAMSTLLMARHRADAELSATALAAAKAASVYVGVAERQAWTLSPSERSAWDELTRTVEAFRRAEVAHSAALRALEDAR